MKNYYIEIKTIGVYTVSIEAENEDEALQEAIKAWNNRQTDFESERLNELEVISEEESAIEQRFRAEQEYDRRFGR